MWTTIISAAVGAAGGSFAAYAGLQQNRRAEEDRVLDLTAESTQLPLARDRHIIGSACARERARRERDDTQRPMEDWPPLLLEDKEVAALFRVLWYFTRVHALYNALPKRWPRKRFRTLLLDSLEPTIRSWAADCDDFKFEGLGPHNRPIAERTRDALKVATKDSQGRRVSGSAGPLFALSDIVKARNGQ